MRAAGAIFLAICLSWLSSQAALAEKRVALVMGNSAYQSVTSLSNPVNDSSAIATLLKDAGFDLVDLKQNLKITEMRRALRDFSDRVRDADIVIVYFAGHGIEIDGGNYLIPVDAVLERDIDAYDEAISLDRILTVIEPAKQLRLVILDACRDNPFSRIMKRTAASRALGRGLARVDPTSPNTLIAFAAKAGSTALDGDAKNSPFTNALVRHLPKPGLDLRRAFGFVRDDVLKATNNRQEPFIYGSLGGNDVPLVRAPAVDTEAKTRRDYELAERVGTREAWDFFLAAYSDGFYAKLALAQRNKLAAEEARLANIEKASSAADEQKRLVAEGARAAERQKLAEDAKAAEQARISAARKKAIEDAKLAEVERARIVAQAQADTDAKAADVKAAAEAVKRLEEARQAANAEQNRIAAGKQKVIDEAKAIEATKAAPTTQAEPANTEADKPKGAAQSGNDVSIGQLALLSPADVPAKAEKPSQAELPRLLQIELLRVGCGAGAANTEWNSAAQKALALYNKNAKTGFDVKVASIDAIENVRSRNGRVCPLVCDRGYRADGDNCLRIICRAGFAPGDDNTCERTGARKQPRSVAKPTTEQRVREAVPARSGSDMSALYAQCRARSRESGGGGGSGGRSISFLRIEACARNGGRL